MAQNVIINGVTYQNVPEVDIPLSGGGTAKFMDTSDANAAAGEILSGKTAYVNGTKITGQISSKSAQTYTPTTSDQTISSGQYLSGAQTIKGDANLTAVNIANGTSGVGVFAAQSGSEVWVYNVGMKETPASDAIKDICVRKGTANMTKGPAMTREECEKLLKEIIPKVRAEIKAEKDRLKEEQNQLT